LAENPEKAFRGNGNKYKYPEGIAEFERLLGKEHAVILFKKAFTITKKIREEKLNPM
jgi:transposase